MRNGRVIRNVLVGAVMAAMLAVMAALPAYAYGEITLDVYPSGTKTKNPVADNITRLNVNKLEKGARDGVVGAKLCIINKETGEMVGEPWISDGTTHEIARNSDDPKSGALDIDVVYILRELEAPEGYAKAADTEFIIHSDNFNTTGEILSGPDAEAEEIHGSGPEQAFVINLYDEATLHVTEEEHRTREQETQEQQEIQRQTSNTRQNTTTNTTSSTTSRTTESSSDTTTSTSTEGLTKTGDDTSYVPVIAIAVIGAAAIGFALYRRRKS